MSELYNGLELRGRFEEYFLQFIGQTWGDPNSRLHSAMRYCLGSGGKRIRPTLALMACQAYGARFQNALAAGVSLEMIHSYSLAHDDLPCLDNDDLRRGKPSLHRAFDEPTALLAGDALLTDAFRVLADKNFSELLENISTDQSLRMVVELSTAAGGRGMVLGQTLDVLCTGKSDLSLGNVIEIHGMKTGALFGASLAMGAIAGGALANEVEIWRDCGIKLGLAFQASDDLLDNEPTTGKSPGKDAAQGKLTILRFCTTEVVNDFIRQTTEEALAKIPSSLQTASLRDFAMSLIYRKC